MNYYSICIILTIGIVGTQIQLPVMDATCNSIREKYEHFSWACGPRSCAEGEKSLHNRYLFEKVRCDDEDPSRICCPTFDYQMTKEHSKNTSASANSSESSKTAISGPLAKKDIDESCSKVAEKYKNRLDWSCQKECPAEGKESEGMDEKISCDQNDDSLICCPQKAKIFHATATSLPPTLTTLASTTIAKGPVTSSQPGAFPTSSQTSPSSPQNSQTATTTSKKKITIPASTQFTTPDNFDVDCEKTSQKYDSSIKWVCETQPCADSKLNQLNVLIKTKTLCDSKDKTKICCAALDTHKPSSLATPNSQDTSTVMLAEDQDSTISTQTTIATTEEAISTTTAVTSSLNDASLTPSDSSTLSTLLTTITTSPPSTTIVETQDDLKPVTLSSPDFGPEEDVLNELKKKRYSVFDHDLLNVLLNVTPRENIIVSPLSIKLLLALILEGSGGQANEELLHALHLPSDNDRASSLLQTLQSFIPAPEDNSIAVLKSQNKIYKAPEVELVDDYQNTIKEKYHTDVETMDFSNPHVVANSINGWINHTTHGFIPSLVGEGDIQSNMKLFFVNFIYLKDIWDEGFDRQATQNGCFYGNFDNPEDCKTVAYMHKKKAVKYRDITNLDAQMVELPFKDNTYVVNFLLPNENSNVHAVLGKLGQKDLYNLFNDLEQTNVDLQLPRFSVHSSSNMGRILQHPQLKIKELFKSTADLSKMLRTEEPMGISNMFHKAKIEINENGKTASGNGGKNVKLLSVSNEKNVAFDRPFLFFIRDVNVGGFLFEGMIMSPDETPRQEESFHSYRY